MQYSRFLKEFAERRKCVKQNGVRNVSKCGWKHAKMWMRRYANKYGAKSAPNHPKRSASRLTLWTAIRKISAPPRLEWSGSHVLILLIILLLPKNVIMR